MALKVEIEKKFFYKDKNKLIQLLEKNRLEKISSEIEKDEYFTDINSEYIKNRTCLRLRKTNSDLVLTFKGKSVEFGNAYAKIENDIKLDLLEYKNIYAMLSSLGFYSYTIVNKERVTYSKKEGNIVFNVMIDFIEEIGSFVEFELLYFEESYDLDELKLKLDNFIKLFKEIDFEEANLPYRDFVAQAIYKKIIPNKKLTTLLIDFDGTLVNTEKVFFESFRTILKDNYNINISYDDYRKNELEKNFQLINYLKMNNKISNSESSDKIMKLVYKEYKNKLAMTITSNEEILNFKLLKKLKELGLKIGLVSTSKREYIDIILQKLDSKNLFDLFITRESVENLKPEPDAYLEAMEKLKVDSQECIAIEDSKRGIKSSINAGIKTIQVNEFINENQNYFSVTKVDKISRLILILINNL